MSELDLNGRDLCGCETDDRDPLWLVVLMVIAAVLLLAFLLLVAGVVLWYGIDALVRWAV